MMGFPKRGEDNLTRATSLCKNFQPNMFNKTKCQNCFRTREAHDLDGSGGNNKPKKVLLCGYLFIAPGLDPENPMPRSRKWQRRCFILYENGELAFALDDSINTTPQGVINMYQCEKVFNADAQTGQKFSLAIQCTTATTFIRAETREEKDSWLETLGEYPEINKENERMKQRQLKLAAQHAARQEKYGKPPTLGSNSKSSPLPSSKSDTSLNNTLNDSWPKSSSETRDILKDQNDQRKDVYQRSQSTLESRPRYSDPTNSFSRSTPSMAGHAAVVDQQDSPTQSSKRKNETTTTLASKSKRADEEMSSARQARLQNEATSVPASQSSRASRMRARVRASDTGITELSKSGAALALGIQRSRSDVVVDRGAYTPLHQNNNNVNFDLSSGFGSRSDPQRRSWRNRTTPDEPLPSTKEVPSPQEKSPRETFPPTKVPTPTTVAEESPDFGRDRSSTNESHTSTVSTSSDDLERLDNPRKANFLVNKAMLDGDSPSPSKRTIERRKHAHNRRARHTMDGSMHVTIPPSSDESETNKEPPATLKRSNSDPNLADNDDMLKRKQIAMTFPGLFHLKKGWLIKQGDGEQDWSKHWFVLCNNKLSYYKDSSDEDPNSLDGVIDLAKCNKASETPVSKNYGFQIELDTGVIILAAMTCGIRNNWVGAINKAIKTALEDSSKKTEESSSLKENKPENRERARSKPSSLLLSKSTSEVQPKEDRSSPLQPVKKLINNVDLTSRSRTISQSDGKSPRSPVETKALTERSAQSTKASPIESLPPHSGKSEGRKSSTSKVSSTSESRPRRGSVPKETEGRRNSVSKEPETRQKRSGSSPRDSSGSESSKSSKSKDRRSRRGSRTERRSQEETAAAVTAALSKRTSNMNSEQVSASTEETVKSVNSDQLTHRITASNSERRSQSSTGDATVIALLEQEVETLKGQLEQKQTDCSRFQKETVNLKAQLNTEQREHKESYLDLENEQSGYMTQIEQMAERSQKSEVTNQKLQAELRQVKNDSHQAQQQVHQLDSQVTNLKNDLQGRDKELDIMKARLEEVIQDLSASENEIGEIKANLKTERERSESLEIELTDTWMKLRTDGIEGLNVDIVERLSAKLDESRTRLEERENDYVTNEERFEKRLVRIQSQFQSENAALQEKLNAALQESERQKAGRTDQTLSSGMDPRKEELEGSLKDVKAQLKAETSAKSVLQKNYNELVAQSAHRFLEGQGDMASTGSDDNTIKLEVDLDEAEKEIDRLKKNSETEREQKTFLEKAFQREQALRKQLEETVSNSTQESGSSEVEQRDAEIVTVRAELKKAKKEREAVNLVRKQLVSAVDSLNAQLSEKERVVEKISAELETRSSQNTKLEEEIQASMSETASLRSRVESMEAGSNHTGRSGPEDQSQLESLRAEQRQLKRQMGSLQEEHAFEMHSRQSELQTANNEIASLQEKLSELQTKWKDAVERATKAENDAAASILEIQKENEQLRSKCERFEKEIKRLRAELHESQDNFDELELQFIHKREDLKRLEQTHEEQIGQMGYRIQDLTSKLASTERKVRDLRGVDHRNRGKGGVGAGGMGMQLTQTRQMETKLKELESKLGDVESTLQNQDQDTSSLLGKIVSVEQQVHNWGQGPSTSLSSVDAEQHQTQPIQLLSCGSSAASAPRDSISTSGADLSEDSEAGASGTSPDRAKQTFRARFLETKLSETELKLKEVTRKLVDVTTRELENRKAYQGKSISESRLKERLKIMECEIAEVTRELQQTRNNGDLVLLEKSHRDVMEEMRQAHNQEMKALEEEKERDLEEERKATSLSLSAIHKSHKQELETQKQHVQQNVSNDVEVVMKRHREVITKMDRDWKIISDKFTKVCSENMSLKKQAESMQKTLNSTRHELETWQGQMKQLIGRKAADMATLRERVLAGYDGEDWGVDGNDNERNPLQVLLRFREAELQCTTNDMNELKGALEVGHTEKKKISDQNVLLEGQHQSQEEYIKQLLTDMEELQQQFERVRTSGEGEAAQDEVVEKSRDSGVGSGDTRGDAKLRSWIPFLKRERSDSSGKSTSSSRRRSGSDTTQTAVKIKKGVTE
ncbi:protein outspread-like isoform X2 [Asterias rubens]|uniref:protein outspread-like isoform X2 n=1 Tax=Asterias rubens TaxID=7604 RepID=UPI0014550DDD|nr:protein outspread-like isoform X2 [Asterias rubens]